MEKMSVKTYEDLCVFLMQVTKRRIDELVVEGFPPDLEPISVAEATKLFPQLWVYTGTFNQDIKTGGYLFIMKVVILMIHEYGDFHDTFFRPYIDDPRFATKMIGITQSIRIADILIANRAFDYDTFCSDKKYLLPLWGICKGRKSFTKRLSRISKTFRQ
jgi:hypothetical protein